MGHLCTKLKLLCFSVFESKEDGTDRRAATFTSGHNNSVHSKYLGDLWQPGEQRIAWSSLIDSR